MALRLQRSRASAALSVPQLSLPPPVAAYSPPSIARRGLRPESAVGPLLKSTPLVTVLGYFITLPQPTAYST